MDFNEDHNWHNHSWTYILSTSLNANVDIQDQDGYPPLILAAHYGYHDIVAKLLKNGAKADILAADGCSALLCGAQNGFTPVVETLLKHPDVVPDPVPKDSVTPLVCSYRD